MKTNAGLMAFLGVIFTIAVGAFFIVPQLKERDTVSVSERVSETGSGSGPETGIETGIGTGAGDAAEAPAASVADEAPASQSAETTDGESDEPVDVASLDQPTVRPSFDILRVEPDGSTVIAGKATPNTRLSIMNGETEIASASVGPSGDFAAILDTPLEPGDYQLTLRTSGDDGNVSESEEVAIVSVPENAEGELLAMVTTPGKASRIIAQPAAPETDGNEADGGTTMSDASGAAADGSGDDSAVETAAATDGSEAETAASGNTGTGGEPAGEPSEDVETGPASGAVADARIETPELPEMSSLLTTTAPGVDTETDTAGASNASGDATDRTPAGGGQAETAAATGTGPSTGDAATESAVSEGLAEGEPASDNGQTEVAALTPDADSADAPRLPDNATVRVDAVEIEGGRIFIAGSAPAGYPVTVSADGAVIGTETADASGRFIVEAEVDLSVGDHIINADLMDPDSGSILLRATVPFNRPEGQALAAVAPAQSAADAKTSRVTGEGAASEPGSETASQDDVTDDGVADTEAASADAGSSAAGSAAPMTGNGDPSGEALVLPDIASLSQMREDAFEALSVLEQMVSNEADRDAAAVAEARKEAIARLKAASSADLAADAEANSREIARSMRLQARSALAALEPAGEEDRSAALSTAAQGDMENLREMLREARSALSQPAGELLAEADQDGTSGAETSAEPRTIVQEPLASAPGAVIIRRGDTLWQISRRTYGQGVRYTTIYLANRSQIENPDRIQPGQVFSVPVAPLENAEELHRKRVLGD
ncbi:MAG: LysM peptidoglycan-binding domain-containing protein [Hoeflea sp.]|uniref:LysM peptidoglycan-binding domain-containing protein n=1 Tax=Hoeflea sp. TaxID=1940281 RepID=UPI0032EBF2A7